MSWDCQSAEYTMKLNNSDLPQEKRRSQEIKEPIFVTLVAAVEYSLIHARIQTLLRGHKYRFFYLL